MLGTITTEYRTLLMNFRATPRERLLIQQGAQCSGESMSDLMRRAVLEARARALAGTVEERR